MVQKSRARASHFLNLGKKEIQQLTQHFHYLEHNIMYKKKLKTRQQEATLSSRFLCNHQIENELLSSTFYCSIILVFGKVWNPPDSLKEK